MDPHILQIHPALPLPAAAKPLGKGTDPSPSQAPYQPSHSQPPLAGVMGSMTEAKMLVSFAIPSAGGCWTARA